MHSFFRRLVSVTQMLGLLLPLGFATTLAPRTAEAAPLQCQMIPPLMGSYLQIHYSQKKMTDELEGRTAEQFIKRLDPLKATLLASDVEQIQKDAKKAFSTMVEGDCASLDKVQKLMVKRAEENLAFVRGYLGDKYELDRTLSIVVDPQKREFPKNQQEREALLRSMVHFQMANYLMTDMKMDEARKQLVHRYELAVKRAREATPIDMRTQFAQAFAQSLDPHSTYLSHDDLQDFQIQMRLSLEGIGATLSSQDGFTVVESIIPGGGADKSGKLRPKDKIIAVKQEGETPVSVIDMELREVVKMIRGPKGTKVTLTVLRQAETNDTFELTIVRDKIDVKDSAASIRYEERKVDDKSLKIGIIDLPSFYGGFGEGRSSYVDVKKLLEEAKKEKVDGIVLDLSRNGGGLLDNAVKISGLFIKEGGVVATRDTRGEIDILKDEDSDVVYTGPLAVLISRVSASASEILAGTLQAYRRAVIVGGDHTFGKGSVQNVINLPNDMGAMKITMGMFFVADGTSTQDKGVAADVRIPSVLSRNDVGEKYLDYSLPTQSIAPFLSAAANGKKNDRWLPVEVSEIKELNAASTARVAKDAEFIKMQEDIARERANEGVIKIAELLDKNGKKKAQDEAEAQAEENAETGTPGNGREMKNLFAPMVKESVNVITDLIALRANGGTLASKN